MLLASPTRFPTQAKGLVLRTRWGLVLPKVYLQRITPGKFLIVIAAMAVRSPEAACSGS